MLIRSNRKKNRLFASARSGLRRIAAKKRVKTLIVSIVSIAVIAAAFAAADKTGFAGKIRRLFHYEVYKIPVNYLEALFARAERIEIDIKDIDFKMLAYDRAIALERGFLLSDTRHEVPAIVRYRGNAMKAKLRLKGNMPDHWTEDKWSFRVNIKDDGTVLGMKQFSIQHPGTREGLNEWCYKKMLEANGLISQRYDFVDVVINGKRMGIYAIEEHFGKSLIENNRRREGPIVYFNDNYLWESVARTRDFSRHAQESYWAADIDEYASKKVSAGPAYEKARYLLESFRSGQIPASKVFDIKKAAGLFAVAELFGSLHSHEYPNVKFYYNPVTSLLEPIGSDVGYFLKIDHLAGSAEESRRQKLFSTWEKLLFEDRAFFVEYIKALERISDITYLDDFFKKTEAEAGHKLRILHKSYPWYKFTDKDVLYYNQKFIHDALNPHKGVKGYVESVKPGNNNPRLLLGNIQTMPIEFLGAVYDGSASIMPAEETVLPGKKRSEPVDYREVMLDPAAGLDPAEALSKNLKVKYRILGSSTILYERVYAWPYTATGEQVTFDMARKPSNAAEFEFLYIDDIEKKILFKPGGWKIDRDLIIPPGYEVAAGEGVRLDLTGSANIISYSALTFCGSEEEPISITSTDSTGQGVCVLSAGGRSLLRYVNFENLSNPHKEGVEYTGAVTFYESPVSISDCAFAGNRGGDDMLNIVRSDAEIMNTSFKDTLSDALDGDFITAKIDNITFLNCGNDGLDISGSFVEARRVSVDGARDKGISVGEESDLEASSLKIANCNIGAASKDESRVIINGMDIYNCRNGLAVYQKKEEFGPAFMEVSGLNMDNVAVPYIIENDSVLAVDGRKVSSGGMLPDAVKKEPPGRTGPFEKNKRKIKDLYRRWKESYSQK